MLLSEPENSKLVKPNISVVKVKQMTTTEDRHQYDITLSAEAIAPFVLLDFRFNSGLNGQFIENGFFIFDGQKTISFQTKTNLTEQQIKEHLVFISVTDVI